jgi:hypothetical protein
MKWIQNVPAFGAGKGRKYSVQTCNGDINSEFLLTLASEWGFYEVIYLCVFVSEFEDAGC